MSKTPSWKLAAAIGLAVVAAACSKSSSGGSPPASVVSVSVSRTSVIGNGTNAVTVTVSDSAGGAVTVTTTKGAFPGGGKSATVQGAGTLTLTTCSTALDATCPGTAQLTAVSAAGGVGATSFAILSLATACAADCTADAACPTLTCSAAGGTGTCSSTTPSACVVPPTCTPSPAGSTSEVSCSDGIDNDCNAKIDCQDTPCDGQPCKAGSPTFVCSAGACTDLSSGLAIQLAPARTRLPADGTTSTAVVVTVTSGGKPAPSMGVTLTTTLGSFSATGSLLTITGTTGADGTATFAFFSSATPGVASLQALITAVPVIAQVATITIPALGSFQLSPTSVQFPVLGVKGSAWNEFGWVQVQVLDDLGNPYPDGLAVRFELQQLGGATLAEPLTADTATCLAAAGCVGHQGAISSGTGVPDTAGLASTFVYAGTVSGTLRIVATASAGGRTRSVALPTVAVVGAKASGGNLAVVCGPRNVPALAETDCDVSLVEAQFSCEAILKDRFGNVLGRPTQVFFESEAASVGLVATTPAYDPAKDPVSQTGLGTALQIFNTLGNGLPADVAPAAGEPSWNDPLDACGRTTHNPRDGAVTVIAVADGEEAFEDVNGNGVYDVGEPFVDLGEPFVDADDNGQRDAGEWFLDVNGNGVYDGPNGRWDANTKIWTQTRVVYTTAPAGPVASGGGLLGTRWADLATFAGACTASPNPAPFSVNAAVTGPPAVPATSQRYAVVAADRNLNRLAAAAAYAAVVEAPGTVKVAYDGLASYSDETGFFFRSLVCDRTGAGCADRCLATGAALPCLVVPSITGYGCGIASTVTITGADKPSGAEFVDWIVDETYQRFGSGVTWHHVLPLAGTNN